MAGAGSEIYGGPSKKASVSYRKTWKNALLRS